MHPTIETKDAILGRWISSPTQQNGKLFVALPQILDGINARLLRKLVVARIAEAQHLRFDARHLTRLGRTGVATIWQIVGIAERHGIYVEIVRVKPDVHSKLVKFKEAEQRRNRQAGHDNLIYIFVDDSGYSDGGKTIRVRRQFHSARMRPIKGQKPGKANRKSNDSWTGKVIKLFSSGRRKAA